MNKAISTLTAASAGVGLAVASTSAKAFIIAPVVAAAVLAGGVLGGAALGSAAANANNNATVVAAAPVAVAPGPAVTVNSTTCYFTHRWINHVRTRVRVCHGPAVAEAPVVAPVPAAPAYQYGYGYGPPVVVTAPQVVSAAPGWCDMISGNHVCF